LLQRCDSAFGTLSLPYLHIMRLAAFANVLPITAIAHVADWTGQAAAGLFRFRLLKNSGFIFYSLQLSF
jgi:hypothetical protein